MGAPEKRSMGPQTKNHNYIWAIGGKIEGHHTVDDTTVYSIEEDRWCSSVNGDLTPIPEAVQGAGWTLYEDEIFCFGGKTDVHTGATDAVQVYDIAADEWEHREPMPEPRSKLGKYYPVVDDRYVYLFGGDNEKGRFNRVAWNWRYDLKKDAWDRGVSDAPFTQSFPLPTFHDGWLYYSTGNTQQKGGQNNYPGALNQRYNPETDNWQVVTPTPHPVTDGSGVKFEDELHFIGGWNTNEAFYNENRDYFRGEVKKQHTVYDYESNTWRYEDELPGHWHHGGTRSADGYLWRYLGTIDEVAGEGPDRHTDRIQRWNGEQWEEMTPAPVEKMNFSTVTSEIGPGDA
jgi:hypothetical protein